MSYLKDVRKQYEQYPYPERNPEDEKFRLRDVFVDSLDRINHYCYSGKKDFSAGFRVLVAGGGTGDSTIFLAEQLREAGENAEVIYVDMSEASIEIARKRAQLRKLNNIVWIHDSLLNIPKLGIGEFDHISCTGVLHHLESPEDGLHALRSVLKEKGAMSIMVYGLYGRTALYQLQELMRLINANEHSMHNMVENCRVVLDSLPDHHFFKQDRYRREKISDIELFDLFLHSQDRAYTVPQLYEFMEDAGLNIVQLFSYYETVGNQVYDPGYYIKNSHLLESIRPFDARKQQAIAELLNGSISNHMLYTAKTVPAVPSPEDLDNIPSLQLNSPKKLYGLIYEAVCNANDYVHIKHGGTGASVTLKKSRHMEDIFRYLDGNRTTREMFDSVIKRNKLKHGKTNYFELGQEFNYIYNAMIMHNWLLLRDKSLPPFKTVEEMQCLST